MKILFRLFARYHVRQVPVVFMGTALLAVFMHFIFGQDPTLSSFFLGITLSLFPIFVCGKHWQFLQGNLNWILTLPIRRSSLLTVSAFGLLFAQFVLLPTAVLGALSSKYAIAIFENWIYSKPFTWVVGPVAAWMQFAQKYQTHVGGALGYIWKELTGEIAYATSFILLSQVAFVGLALCVSIPPSRTEAWKGFFRVQSAHGRQLGRDHLLKYCGYAAILALGSWMLVTSKLIFAFGVGLVTAIAILRTTLNQLHLHRKWQVAYIGLFTLLMTTGDFVLYKQVTEQLKNPSPVAMRESLSWLGKIGDKKDRAVLVRGLLAAQDKPELIRAWREIRDLTHLEHLTNQAAEGVVYMDGIKRWNDPETLATWISFFTPTALKADEIKSTLIRVDAGLNPRALTNPTVYGLLAVPLVPVEVDEFLKSTHPRFFAFGVYKARFQRDKDYIPQIRKNLATLVGKYPSLQVDLFQISRMTLSILSGQNLSYDQVLPVLKFMRAPASEGIVLDCAKVKPPREWKSLNSDQLARYNVCLRERTARKDPKRIKTVLSEGWYVSPLASNEIEALEFAFN